MTLLCWITNDRHKENISSFQSPLCFSFLTFSVLLAIWNFKFASQILYSRHFAFLCVCVCVQIHIMFIYLFIFKLLFFFYFTILYWFCHTSTCISHGCTGWVFPILNLFPTSLPVPPLWVIPVHQHQASCILHWTWTGNSFLIRCYTCFNAILPNHPTLPLPKSPKDCSRHLCLFCCLAYRVVITLFLNSIYMCVSILYWCFSFWLTSLCIIGSSFIHLIRTDSNVFFLMAE